MWTDFVARARTLGYASVGVADVSPFDVWQNTRARRNDGFGKALYADPRELMPEAKRIIVLAHPYADVPEMEAELPYVQISPYYVATNALHGRSSALAEHLRGLGARTIDRPALPAKAAARRSGIGNYGRNALLYTPEYGSRVILDLLLTDAELPLAPEKDDSSDLAACEGCDACVRACPVGALDGLLLDTSRCLRAHMLGGKEVPEALRSAMGNRFIGCEICQRVCPQNQRARRAEPYGESPKVELAALLDSMRLGMELERLARAIGDNYARRLRVQVQAALIAGNSGDARHAAALRALAQDEHAVLSAHARWALNKLGREANDE